MPKPAHVVNAPVPSTGSRIHRVPARAALVLLAAATAFGPMVALAPSAAADPIGPSSLPPEGDTSIAIRQADALDAIAGHTHDFATNGSSAGPLAAGPLAAGRTALGVAAIAGPIATRALPVALDVRPAYAGQVSCDPVEKPGARAFAKLMTDTYGSGTTGITRWCNAGVTEHSEGRAIDWMLDSTNADQKAIGDAAAAWLSDNDGENARRLGVMYLIWNRQMWRAYAPERGWAAYTGASPHTDHIHISLTWDGAMQRTSWWTGRAVTSGDRGPCLVYKKSPAPIYAGPRTGSCPAEVDAPTSSYPVFVPGQRSESIKVAQRALNITADGQFGYGTRRAVLDYQGREGLPRTGVLDKATWVTLVPSSANTAPNGADGVADPATTQPPATTVGEPTVVQPPTRQIPARVVTRYSAYKNTRIGLGSRGTLCASCRRACGSAPRASSTRAPAARSWPSSGRGVCPRPAART